MVAEMIVIFAVLILLHSHRIGNLRHDLIGLPYILQSDIDDQLLVPAK